MKHIAILMANYAIECSCDARFGSIQEWGDHRAEEAWDEGNLAAYPLQLAVGHFIDNGGDAWGNLDDAYEQVSAASNPYREQEAP